MSEFTLSYREVVPDLTIPEKWKEFNLNTGGTQSLLQDIKIPEKANGYCYKDASKYYTRNRFIYWRINNDILELVEQSLDVNLSGNRARFRFTDTAVLDGITIHEYYGSVIILVPTVCSIHRLVFNHPDKIHKQDDLLGSYPNLAVPSIFADISPLNFNDASTFHVISHPNSTSMSTGVPFKRATIAISRTIRATSLVKWWFFANLTNLVALIVLKIAMVAHLNGTPDTVLPHIASSYLNIANEESIFVFAYPSGDLLLVRHYFSGKCTFQELKQETIVPRFLSGIAGALRGKNLDNNVAVSIVLHSLGLEIFVFTLFRDGNLRIWSCTKAQYVSSTDILAETGDSSQILQGAQTHILRKSVTSNDTDFTLAIFLSFSNECQFHIVKPTIQNGLFKIVRLSTLYAADQDIMDFSLDNKRLWAVWRGIDGECYVNSARLEKSGTQWVPVILNPNLDPEYVTSDFGVDPRQSYMNFIFHPGRFPLSVITKALSIYKRSAALSDVNLSPAILKQRISMAVEQEIQTEVHEYEISDEDYLEIANRCWSKFYSCCVQYYLAGTKPLGLLLLPSVSGAVLLKKSTYSFLRPLDSLEHLMLCSDCSTVEQFQHMTYSELSQDADICNDLIQLMGVLVSLEQQLNEEFKYNIEKELNQLRSPDKIMSELVIDLMAGSDSPILSTQFLWTFSQKLSNCSDLYRTMHLLLEMLRLETIDSGPERSKQMKNVSHLFSSELGVSFVSESLHQIATVRFSICRNLLLLQNILLERRELEWGVLEAIRSVCMPDTVVFMQAYYIITWLCEQTATTVSLSDDTIQRLAPLKLSPVFNLKSKNKQTMTLLQLFATSTGGCVAHSSFVKNVNMETLPFWHHSLLDYVNHLGQLVWAVSGDFILGEWLLTSGQHLILQQYVRLLNLWCEWNNCSRNFVLAVALLNNGEKYKAQDLFLKSSKGIFVEKFLAEKILGSNEENDAKALVNYHLKVIQLFELYGARDCAINVARTALSAAEADDPHIATLHSVIFVHHLQLSHFEEAYNSLIANPDKDRREDNLRDLVKTLLDNKKLDLLMSFPYVDMLDTFTNIVTARARACDAVRNIFYDFLYSFEVKRGNMRLAATAMYEQAYRLGQHNTLDALEQQVKCYLACLNSLYLVEDSFKWVIRPVDQGEEEEYFTIPVPASSNDVPRKVKINHEIKAIQLETIKKEYVLASARLKLARCNPKTLANQFSTPFELVTMLSNMGLFKTALNLSKTFRVSNDIVFETLAKVCVRLTRKDNPNAWNWLIENDLADLPFVSSSPASVSWDLLKVLIEEYEEPKMSSIHKVVCQKIIHLAAFLPHWLLASYKKRNPAELIRLFLRNGRLLECAIVSKEYLWAALGKGKEYYGLEHSLISTAKPLCLPIYQIDKVVTYLHHYGKNMPKYQKEHDELKYVFKTYLETAQRVSNDMARIAWQNKN